MTFPISISRAARELGIPQSTASVLVATWHIPTCSEPVQPRAKMLDLAAYDRLAEKARPFQRAVAAR